MNREIRIKIPYPVKIGFITISISRRIGFSFDQRSLYNLTENNNIDLDVYPEWIKQVGNSGVIREMLFAAACSYAEKHTLRKWFTKDKLTKAFIELSESEQNRILDAWRNSEQFGFKTLPGSKKKAKMKSR